MNLKQAMERIEALEARIRALECLPAQQIHYHYHPDPTRYSPLLPQPMQPQPIQPCWPNTVWFCSIGAGNT